MALDIARLVFAPVVTASAERVAKQVDSFWSGLTVGLIEEDGVGLPGFNGLAQFHKAITSEARLATAPVVQEFASSSHSNGNLDRAGMATFAARKTMEVAGLSGRSPGSSCWSRPRRPRAARRRRSARPPASSSPWRARPSPSPRPATVPHLDPLLRHVEARRKEIDPLVGADG